MKMYNLCYMIKGLSLLINSLDARKRAHDEAYTEANTKNINKLEKRFSDPSIDGSIAL